MVAIVTGAGLGLDNSSEKVFGAVGQGGGVLGSSAFNRFGENVTVNAATGNLMIDRTDEVLIGRGPDEIVSRGYNSQSMNMGYGAWHDWQFGDARCIAPVTGTVNQAGSSVTRIDSDGSNLVYNYDTGSGTYICSTGGNGEYRLSYNTSTQIWTWTDSKNNLTETYDAAHNGRILLATDNSGNALSFSYDGVTGLLTKATTANGETTTYNYTANNQVKSITTKKADNSTLIRVRYAYDSSFRLSTVTTDLTPNDSSVTDGIKVVTTYTYDGTSDRVAKITQTGGGELDITYTQLGSGAYAVATVKEIVTTGTNATSRTTSFQYNTGNTVITDPNGNTTTLTFDGNNQLTGVTYPTDSSGTRPSYVYTYNGTGDLKSVTDPYSNLTKYAYDPNDNLSKITDTFGNTTTFTYDANNHVLTKTYAAGNGQSGPTVTLSYAYDSSENLRYFVDGDNEVTEYRYNGYGQRTAKILYSDNPYTGGTITESALTTWVNSIANKSTSIRRTDYTYDLRGNPATATSYALCTADATGAGVTTNSPYTQVIYVYDQAGNLLQRQTVGQGTNIETFAYDGLNRIIQSQDLNGGISTVSWSDATNSCSVTMANGLVRVSNYDDSGHLVSVIQNGDTTSYKYDTLGQLGIVSDSQAGTSSYALFDNLGRKTADILADGSLTEYRYDLNGRLVASIVHANKLTSTQLTQLVGSNGNPTNVALSSVLPLPDPGDVWNWRIYDADGRLVETIDGDGGVTSMTYDDMSNLTSTTVYYNVLSSSTLSGFKTTLPNAVTLPTVSAAHDDTTSYYYDSEGRQIGVLNGDGFLTETVYNDAGEKIRTVAHSIAVASSHRGDAFSAIVGLASGTGDLKARYFYDDRGLLTIALDPMLRATKYVYDNANRVTQTILYNGTVGTQQNESAYTLSYVQSQLSSLSGDSANRVSWNVYKTDTGKLDYTIDAAGTVTGFTYDNMGEVTQKSVYATQRTTTMPPLQSDMDSWAATYGSGATDRKTRYVYDTLGNLRFTIDPEHYVVENRYDGSGRLNLTIQYTSTYTPNSIPQLSDMVAWAGGTIPSDAVQTTFSYDADWRLTDTVRDGTGLAVDTRTAYDAQGRVQKVTDAYGSGDDSATYYSYDSAGRLKTVTRGFGTSAASTTQYAYDGQGNILTETDGNNNVTTYTYDVAGQMLTKTDALNNVTSYTYDSFGNVLTTTDPLTHVIYSFYDALNRQILQLDQLGYGTATTYTIGGAVASVTRYATPYNGTITPGVPPTLTTSAQDATTTFTRDKLDRATQVTDAEGFYEKYDLDAFGDRIHIFAKSAAAGPQNGPGGETIDTYDRRGQILTETLPEASYDSSGNQLAATVTNTYSYDSRGNLTQKVEASGLPEHRTTNYTYDKLNRLTLKTEDSFLTLNSDLSAGGRVTPTWTYQYDKRGNVIKTTDPINAVTQTYYDALNRKVAQVDALGDYTQWSYDANSNMLTATSYATAFGTMPAAGGAAPSPLSPSQSRQISYGYDAINRLTSTTVANLLTGSYNGTSYTTATTNVTTTNVYNKTANSLQQIDGNGNSTWSWYDYLGRKIAEVDRDKYITLYTLDSNGNATQETRYVNAYVGSITGSTTYSSIQGYAGAHADNTNDRTTTFLYDRNGQRKQETRLNVAAWTVNADGTLTAAPTSSTINYTYNGLGEVLSKQEATGDTTTYTYDAAGRQIAVDLSSFASGGVTMQLHTLEDYDGLGDLTYTSAYDQLAGTRVYHNTSYTYGGDGILSSMIDANGFERDYSYDADKHLILTNYSRLHSDGTSTTEGDFANYDALGRAIAQGTATKSGGVWGKNDTEQTAYNAYGDVVSKSVNGVVQQTFAYDNGGRMWESTDEGVYTVNLYDKDGNQTLSVTSDGNALASGSWSGFASANDVVTAMGTIGVTQPQGMVETITVYDARSQATSSRLPSRQLSANYYNSNDTEDIITYRTYNAFGEVLTEKDGNAHTTTYTYNTLGKVTSQALPSTTVYDEHNNSSSTNPTQLDYYDLSGRLVGTRDANGNLNTRWLLANTGYGGSDAQAIEEFHADGGKPVNTYDVFGDLTEATNEVGAKTDYTYDGQGQVLTETHPLGAGGQRLVDTYTYDGLGQRLTHWNSEFGSSYVDRTDYDAEGRVAQTVDMEGHATTYGYVWSNTLSTGGLGQFGGWTKTTTLVDSVANRSATEQEDVDGRTIGKTDFGGNVYGYTYDLAGRLSTRTDSYIPAGSISGGGYSPSGEVMTYTYYNTGQVKKITSDYEVVSEVDYLSGPVYYDGHNIKIADYSYDKNGNEVFEDGINRSVSSSGTFDTLVDYEVATYNNVNRMTSLTASAPTISGVYDAIYDPITISWKYDANGNVRYRGSTYYLLDPNGNGNLSTTQSSQNDWYTYDSMNRFLITQGTLDQNNNIVTTTTGTTITYDQAGERLTAVGNGETDTYHYAADGHITQADIATSGGTQHAYYTNDLMGRVTYYEEDNTSGTKVYSKQTTFNHISQTTQDVVYTVRPNDGTYTWTTNYDYREQGTSGYNGVYDNGVVTHDSTTTVKQGGNSPPGTDAVFSYLWSDNPVQSGETYDSDTGNANNALWTSVSTFDQRHDLTNATMADGYSHGVGYAYNIDGEVLFRQEGVAYPVQAAPIDLFFYFGGKQIGNISNNGTSNVGYVASITQQTTKPGNGFFTDGATSGTSYADFDQSYNAVNGLTYGQSPSTYTVQAGDTLQSIALQIWGDSNFWYLLADANGLDPSAQLDPGITLVVPNDIANNQNNTSTYRPYDPNAHIGDISPTHPPKPQPHHGCGILGEILLAVIAVVVTILAPQLAPETFEAMGTLGSLAASAAIGDLASQGVGLATGIQKSFSWAQLGMSVLSAGVNYGVGGSGLDLFGGLSDTVGSDVVAALQGATASAITQGIGVATGLQKSFNWAQVAAAGVSAGVGEAVGTWAEGTNLSSTASDALVGAAGLIAGAAARSLITGTDFGDNILKDLPDTIGQTVGSVMEDEIQQEQQATIQQQIAQLVANRAPQASPPIDGSLAGSPEYAGTDGSSRETYDSEPGADGIGTCTANVPVPMPRPETGDLQAAAAAGYSDKQILEHLSNGDHYDASQGGWFNQNGIESVIVSPSNPNQSVQESNSTPFAAPVTPSSSKQKYTLYLVVENSKGFLGFGGIGHAFIGGTGPDGKQLALGFYPKNLGFPGDLFSPGNVTDNTKLLQAALAGDDNFAVEAFTVDADQYNKAMSYMHDYAAANDYDVFSNNCETAALNSISTAGISNTFSIPFVYPHMLYSAIKGSPW